MRSRGWTPIVLVVALAASGGACADLGPTEPAGAGTGSAPDLTVLLADLAMDTALARISASGLARHIGALADDSMMGRLTGASELEDAAAYVATALEAVGVEPAGTDGFLARWSFMPSSPRIWEDSLARQPPNVVGIVRGSDPDLADSYVVVTAHYDHVGVGAPDPAQDSIFNGADDNASGTAVLLEVAEALGALPTPPRRSVMLLAVSGEELGLLGSNTFVADPTVPLEGMVANINLDMVSRGAMGVFYAIGHPLSSLGPLAGAVASQYPGLGVVVRSDAELGQNLVGRSDHFSFGRRRVPALGLFGGFHPDYHTRDDEADRVDPEKAAAAARLAVYVVAAVAMLEDPPTWTSFGVAYMQPYW